VNPQPSLEGVEQAVLRLRDVVRKTPWEYNERLSNLTNASVFIKREDLQQIRSFKIRGAYNKISSLTASERVGGIVCASAGNHAQGVAYRVKNSKFKVPFTCLLPLPNKK